MRTQAMRRRQALAILLLLVMGTGCRGFVTVRPVVLPTVTVLPALGPTATVPPPAGVQQVIVRVENLDSGWSEAVTGCAVRLWLVDPNTGERTDQGGRSTRDGQASWMAVITRTQPIELRIESEVWRVRDLSVDGCEDRQPSAAAGFVTILARPDEPLPTVVIKVGAK